MGPHLPPNNIWKGEEIAGRALPHIGHTFHILSLNIDYPTKPGRGDCTTLVSGQVAASFQYEESDREFSIRLGGAQMVSAALLPGAG